MKYLKKTLFAMLFSVLAGCMAISLMACGSKEEIPAKAKLPVEPTQSAELDVAEETTKEVTQEETASNGVPYSYNGAYTDGTNYLVFDNGEIALNGQKCEVTKVSTDHFKGGVALVYFTYDGNEISAYDDPVCGMSCSLEQDEGSWLTYETIALADVPVFEITTDDNVSDTADNKVPEEPTTTNAPVNDNNDNNFADCPPVTVTIAGDQITFPATAESLENLGWTWEDHGGSIRYTKGDYMFNPYDGYEYAQKGQSVSGFNVGNDINVVLDTGISFDSSYDDVVGAYGEPDTIYGDEVSMPSYNYKNSNGLLVQITFGSEHKGQSQKEKKIISFIFRYE